MSNRSFFNGALILIIFNLIGKVLGAIYRIPLAGILGGVGMGQYQLVFPLYCLILTISTSGIPATISKMVAEFNTKKSYSNSRRLLWLSVVILSLISILGFIAIILCARTIATLQGNPESYICYYGIAPAILFVGVISAFRGYFQGNLKMLPTAISGLIEQIFKMTFGLTLAYRFSEYGVSASVFGALVGTSISEIFSFLFLFVYYIVYSKKQKYENTETLSRRVLGKELMRLSIPVTIGGLISPITSMVDSFLVVNLLMLIGFTSKSATGLLGLQAGVVEPLINLPVVISISIGTAILPNISSMLASDSRENVNEMIKKSFQISLCISIAFALCYVIFGKQILYFLYHNSFTEFELMIATKLLFLASLNILFLSLVQVSAGILQGMGKPNYTVKSLLIGCIVKIIVEVVLVSLPSVNIYGATISAGVCYLVVFILDYRHIKRLTGVNLWQIYKSVAIQEFIVCLFAFFGNALFELFFSKTISMFLAGAISVFVFLLTYYLFFINKKAVSTKKFFKNIETK